MKKEAIKDYLILNGKLIKTCDTLIFKEIIQLPIYEVIRVIDGVPLFLEDHIERMRKSSDIVNYPINKSDDEIKKEIKKLIEVNKVKNLNVKLLCTDIKGKGQVFLTYFIKSYYPEEELYRDGIHTISYNFERENPNAKILNISFKQDVNNKIKKQKAFEALLVNKSGYITEGSRSNMFFVKGSVVYTSPKRGVLLGVTRKHIIQACLKLNIKVIEESIHVDDLNKIDGGFMSGTSVNVLPIKSIDKKIYNSTNNTIIREISKAYLEHVRKYLDKNKMK